MQNDKLACCVSELTCSATWIGSPSWYLTSANLICNFLRILEEFTVGNKLKATIGTLAPVRQEKKKMNAIANSRFKTPMVSWFVWSPALFCFENVCAQKMAIKTKLTVDTHQTDSVKYPLFLLSQNHLFDYSIMWNCLANKTIRYFLRSNHKSFQLSWRIKAS